MTDHARKLLREAAKVALVAANTRAGTRVESSRPNPLSQRPNPDGGTQELPALILYTRSTKSEIFDESPRRYRNTTELAVEAVLEVGADTDIDDDLDAFELEVVNALLRDDTLAGTVNDLKLQTSTNTIDGSAAKLLAAVIITFEAEYFTEAPAEGTLTLDDLSTVHTEISLGGAQADTRDRAKDDIEDLSA